MISPEAIACLSENPFVKLNIPTRHQGVFALDAAVRHFDSPLLDLEIHPAQIPHDEVVADGEWLLKCERESSIHAFRARFHGALDDRTIRLEILRSSVHPIGRGSVRVDADVYLKIDSPQGGGGRALKQKVNLSDCGLRFISERPLYPQERLRLEIVLPGSSLEVIHCEGRVVRVSDAGERGTEAAMEIERIEAADRSKLQSFCMTEQFRRMQSKVRVLATFLAPSLAGSGE